MSSFKTFNSMEELFKFLESLQAPSEPDGMITIDMLEGLTADRVLTIVKASAAGANNDIVIYGQLSPEDLGQSFSQAVEFMETIIASKQRQAEVWMALYDRLQVAEERAKLLDRLNQTGHPFDLNLGEEPERA